LTGILRQFCRAQKCQLRHKKCSRILFNSAEVGLLMVGNRGVLVIPSKGSGFKCIELGLFYLGLFIAQCFIDYWQPSRYYILDFFQKLLRKQLFLILLTLWQPTNVRKTREKSETSSTSKVFEVQLTYEWSTMKYEWSAHSWSLVFLPRRKRN